MAKQTITKIIRKAKKYLGVSSQEIMNQMIEFYKLKNSDGMKQMFEAYKNWEIRRRAGSRTIEETIKLSKKNFDFVARIADGYLNNKDIEVGLYQAVQLPKNASGPVSQFYRKAIDYHPFDPSMN